MTILNEGRKTTVGLQIGEKLTIAAGVGTGTVVRTRSDDAPTVFNGAERTLGPYDNVEAFIIQCSTGAMDYSIARAVKGKAPPTQFTIRSGANRSFYIPAGCVATVSAYTGGQGRLVPFLNGGEPGTPIGYFGTALTVGPFDTYRIYTAVCLVGLMTVRIASPVQAPAPNVNDARYADYIAFADARTGLYAVPDGLGGKRQATAEEFWATAANASFDTATNGVQDIVLSAQTSISSALVAVANATEATIVFERYGGAINDRVLKPSGSNDLFLLVATDNARMIASSVVLQCFRRRGGVTTRFRGITAWSAVGRTLALNGGNAAEDTTQPGNRSSPNFIAGRYIFIGLITTRKSAAWIKGNSFPEPSAVIHGDSFAQGDTTNTGQWWAALSPLLPGSPPMEIMGVGGTTGAQIEAAYLTEAPELACKRIVWGGHNSYDAEDWKTRVANMVANTNGGIANFALLPVFPNFADNANTLSSKASLHAYMKATYGTHYLGNVLDDLVAMGAPGQQYADATSYGKGVPPAGLRYDPLHLSKYCNEQIVAPMIKAAYAQLGWRY